MSSARLLILGVLRIRQPTHGYEIRRELESWHAENWANIAYGSIYHALRKMSEEGLVEPVVHTGRNRVNNRPARTSYAITDRGEAEFQRLLREFWWQPKPAIDPFQVALTFMNDLPRDELLLALRRRADLLRLDIEGFEWAAKMKMTPPDTPQHIAENMRLAAAQAEASLQWTEETIERIERDELP